MAVAILERLASEVESIPAPSPHPDASLLAMCAEFDRRSAALSGIPAAAAEEIQDFAWTRRQDVIGVLAYLRPATDEGRRAKARVAMQILGEVAGWERGPEWEFALGCFQAERVGAAV